MKCIPLGAVLILGLLTSALCACSGGDTSPGPEHDTHTAAIEDDAAHDEHAREAADGHAEAEGDEHGDEHQDGQGHDEHGHEEGEPDFARIDPERAAEHGIEVAKAGPGRVAESIALTGRLIIDPRRVALVSARFAGPVRRVMKHVGESVRRGEPLAQVESNESLTVYDVLSPLTGVVLERMTNVGDVAGSEPLFRIGDVTDLQVELKAFPKEQTRITRGANVIVLVGDEEAPGKIVSLVPEVDSHTQAMLVRVALAPRKPIEAVPGQFVTGQVLVGQGEVAVPVEAVQRLGDRQVVFVPEENGFRMRGVTTGRRDGERIEITEGLSAGEPYVAAGAFLVKAEIGKNLAGHDH